MQLLKFTNRHTLIAILILYMAILVKYILFKRPVDYIEYCFINMTHLDIKRENWYQANLIPFKIIFHYLSGAEGKIKASENVIGNFIGFMPLGLLAPLLFDNIKSIKTMLLVSFLTSFSFELVQLITGLGIFDVDDLILNTTGGIAGYFVFTHFHKHLSVFNS